MYILHIYIPTSKELSIHLSSFSIQFDQDCLIQSPLHLPWMELVMLAFGRSSRLLDKMLHPFTVTMRNWEYDVHPYIMIHDIFKSYAKSAKCSTMINYDIQIFHDTSIGHQLTKGLGLPALKWMVLS